MIALKHKQCAVRLQSYKAHKLFSLDRRAGPFGGAKRDRTADLLHAMQALSQLSYSPYKNKFFPKEQSIIPTFLKREKLKIKKNLHSTEKMPSFKHRHH